MVSLAYKDEWAAMIRYCVPPESSQVSAAIENDTAETQSTILQFLCDDQSLAPFILYDPQRIRYACYSVTKNTNRN